MGIVTNIEYSDSTLNLEIGCAGCELWTADGKVRTCYAGNQVNRYAGHSYGYPQSFDKPVLFLYRLIDALKWPDLTGKERKEKKDNTGKIVQIAKPWLDGKPRFIFLNDLGDTFTEGLPDDWLGLPSDELKGFSPLQILAQMKAVIMILTKRATQMRQFFEKYECPDNFIVMTSITGPETINRVRELVKIKARWRGVSAEPLLRDSVDAIEPYLSQLHWCAMGSESGKHSRFEPQHVEIFRSMLQSCVRYGTWVFMKQLDKIAAIPDDLMVRQLPDFTLR